MFDADGPTISAIAELIGPGSKPHSQISVYLDNNGKKVTSNQETQNSYRMWCEI